MSRSPHGSADIGFCVLYRFRLKQGAESEFRGAWAKVTRAIRNQRGGLGSRLHLGDDGLWYAYAQWPDRASWEASSRMGAADEDASRAMSAAIEESFAPIALEPMDDLLSPATD